MSLEQYRIMGLNHGIETVPHHGIASQPHHGIETVHTWDRSDRSDQIRSPVHDR